MTCRRRGQNQCPGVHKRRAGERRANERRADKRRAHGGNKCCCQMSENLNSPGMDSAEPTVGSEIVPVWMVVLFGALFYWCQLYLAGHAGGFNKEVYAPFDSIEELAAAQPKSEEGKFMAEGQAVFHQTCELCHQVNGLGKEGQFPPLAGSDWVLAPGPNRIGRIVLDGLTGPITIKGRLFNVGGTWSPGARFTQMTSRLRLC